MTEAKRQANTPAPREYLRDPARLSGINDKLLHAVLDGRSLLDREDPPSEEDVAAGFIELEKARAMARPICRTLRRAYLRRGIFPFLRGMAMTFILMCGEDLIYRGDFSPLYAALETARAWLVTAAHAGLWIVAGCLGLYFIRLLLYAVCATCKIACAWTAAACFRACGWFSSRLLLPAAPGGAES